MSMERSMGPVPSSGQTTRNILVSSITITSMAKVSTHGAMAGGMRVSGKTTRCTERGPSPGPMVGSTLENT